MAIVFAGYDNFSNRFAAQSVNCVEQMLDNDCCSFDVKLMMPASECPPVKTVRIDFQDIVRILKAREHLLYPGTTASGRREW